MTLPTTDKPSVSVDHRSLARSVAYLTGPEMARSPVLRKLLRIVALAAETFGQCAAGVTVVGQDSRVCTSKVAYWLDDVQRRFKTSPGADATTRRRVVTIGDIATCPHEEFRRMAADLGIRSSLSVPLVAGGAVVGVLNLYSPHLGFFAGCEASAAAFARAAASAITARP